LAPVNSEEWEVTGKPARILAIGIAAIAVCVGAVSAGDSGDLRDLSIGMSISDIPPDEYVDLRCASLRERRLAGWAEYDKCPTDAAGLRGIAFRFNDRLNPLARVNDKYEGTKVAGHPVVLTLSVNDRGTIEALRIDTHPEARLFLRKKAHLLAMVVKSRFGEDGWNCRDLGPSDGESPVGGVFIKDRCEKTANDRKLVLERSLYRRAGQSVGEFVSETRFEIR
jgi:hypothetical protein